MHPSSGRSQASQNFQNDHKPQPLEHERTLLGCVYDLAQHKVFLPPGKTRKTGSLFLVQSIIQEFEDRTCCHDQTDCDNLKLMLTNVMLIQYNLASL